ncbi:MAG: hypothetical protein LBQ89_07950 [Treponema sp.]|jgi:hypothetical protein|nr:hypothetical protein [Treponema sp.]
MTNRKDGKNVIFKLVDLPQNHKIKRIAAIRERAEKLGVINCEFEDNMTDYAIESAERTLDILEREKNRNAWEA